MRLALVQMNSSASVSDNNDSISASLAEASEYQPDCVFFPEVCNIMQKDKNLLAQNLSVESEDPTLSLMTESSYKYNFWIHAGSIALKDNFNENKPFCNRSFLIDNQGQITASYDKIHLFDVTLPDGEISRESESYTEGEEPIIAETPFGIIGLSICYDLRFPYLFSAYSDSGATILAIPAAFTEHTGRAHWETLLRARAIENACFVVAAAQCGHHQDGRKTFGHSMVVGPWGEVISCAENIPTLLIVDIETEHCNDVRQAIPVIKHRKLLKEPAINFPSKRQNNHPQMKKIS